MRRWSEVADRVAATTKTSEKTSILAGYLVQKRIIGDVNPERYADAIDVLLASAES